MIVFLIDLVPKVRRTGLPEHGKAASLENITADHEVKTCAVL